MKTMAKFGTFLSLVLVAGCAHRAQYSKYDQTYQTYTSPNTRTYENPSFRNNTYNSSTYSPSYSSSVNETVSPSLSQTTSVSSANDQVLVTQIRQSLNNNPNLAEVIPNIQVTAQNGTVILNGTVPNEQQKQAVETMVKSTAGVMNVNNQLQVNLSPTASKSLDKSGRTYSGAAAASADVPGSLPAESKGAAADSTNSLSGSSSAALTSTNSSNPSTPSQGLPPTSDRQDLPRLYSTNNTGISNGPQSSLSGDRSAAVSAGVAASQSGTSLPSGTNQNGTSQGQSGTSQSATANTQSGTAQSVAGTGEHKDLSASADTGQKSAIYSNGPSASVTNNSSRSTLYTATGRTTDDSLAGTNSAGQPGAEDKDLTATGNSRSRRYAGTNTNANTTVSTAAATSPETFETNVQGASQADQAVVQKVISEMRADTSLAALLPGIHVKIENGKAILSGTVKSQDEKLKLETAVQKVTGVTSVDNQLRIGSTSAPAPIR